MKSSEY